METTRVQSQPILCSNSFLCSLLWPYLFIAAQIAPSCSANAIRMDQPAWAVWVAILWPYSNYHFMHIRFFVFRELVYRASLRRNLWSCLQVCRIKLVHALIFYKSESLNNNITLRELGVQEYPFPPRPPTPHPHPLNPLWEDLAIRQLICRPLCLICWPASCETN